VGVEKFRREVERLEDERRGREPEEIDPTFWHWLLEDVARHLLFEGEPEFTADGEGNLYSIADGRLVGGPSRRVDLRDLIGDPLAERMNASSDFTWRRFLIADDEAEDLLERILARGQGAEPPEDFRVCVGLYVPDGGDPDPEDLEALRRLTWTLATDTEAMRLLSELTRRRDSFMAAEGVRPEAGYR
jgi:hypothetical protein